MTRRGLGPALEGRNPRVVSWGELLWDLFPEGPKLGGSGANVAVHAALLGAKSHLISGVGNDALGQDALQAMTVAGVETSGIAVHRSTPTGRVRITFKDGEPDFKIEEGVAWDRIAVTDAITEAILGADAFCFSTLAQRTPLMRSRLSTLLDELQAARCPAFGAAGRTRPLCVLDLNLRPPFTDRATIVDAVKRADVVKLNEHEAQWVCTSFGCGDAVTFLLRNFDVRLVALTQGAQGASLTTRATRVQAAPPPASGGDPVGAGDAFVAGLSVALATSASVPRALEVANAHGAWVAGQHGAMPHLS